MPVHPKPTLQDVIQVMRDIIVPFHAIKRAVPLPITGPDRWENDAEHSWSLALIACMLAPHIDPGLNVGTIAQFACVHDLVEVFAGDTSAFAKEHDHLSKQEREHAALQKIGKDFAHIPWLVATLHEYERQDSDEAKYVRSIDKFVPLVYDYLNDGAVYHKEQYTKEDFIAFMERPREKAKVHPGAFEYHEAARDLLLNSPHLFYQPKH